MPSPGRAQRRQCEVRRAPPRSASPGPTPRPCPWGWTRRQGRAAPVGREPVHPAGHPGPGRKRQDLSTFGPDVCVTQHLGAGPPDSSAVLEPHTSCFSHQPGLPVTWNHRQFPADKNPAQSGHGPGCFQQGFYFGQVIKFSSPTQLSPPRRLGSRTSPSPGTEQVLKKCLYCRGHSRQDSQGASHGSPAMIHVCVLGGVLGCGGAVGGRLRSDNSLSRVKRLPQRLPYPPRQPQRTGHSSA